MVKAGKEIKKVLKTISFRTGKDGNNLRRLFLSHEKIYSHIKFNILSEVIKQYD